MNEKQKFSEEDLGKDPKYRAAMERAIGNILNNSFAGASCLYGDNVDKALRGFYGLD